MYVRGWSKYSLIDIHGTEWKRVRTLLSPFFSTSKLKDVSCIEVNDRIYRRMDERMNESSTSSLCSAYTLDMICSSAFGLQVDSQTDENDKFLALLRKLTNLTVGAKLMFICFTFPFVTPLLELFGVNMFPRGYLKFFETMTKQLLNERLNNPSGRRDFIETMARAHLDDIEDKSLGREGESRKGLTNEEILAQTLMFVQGGYDTTSRSLVLTMYCLALHPEVQEKVHREILDVIGDKELTYDNLSKLKYMEMCINETTRCYPAFIRFDRRATQDIVLDDGLHIREGTLVVVPVWAIHHDPNIYPDPDKFDPERFSPEACANRNPLHHLPFGAGHRICLGMRLAQMAIKMAMVGAMKRFKFVPTDKTEVPLKLKKYSLLVLWDNSIHLGLEKRA
ncbi:hypothetical protein HELRODRAFT_111479 [Helobdella robusta]|uniref:Uncharacterized protein n=1 Tax=Helobdella robusta TaxID=6412 RepID=T1EFB8_HELRO|nr:hypothetical protein HELRODRAFT_111479 [Helobdella robusta]ESO05034.1 hypothetical protein HELRODRAFT_111479 [Helobdella robusta]